ncbi:PIN domain-containing protein [candidate division KSB1 bacterium]|nr:PIN domain-containing protein [candidate division KSB1 bacterium]
MRYLLDTHALLWIVGDDSRLSRKVRRLYLDESNEMLFSMAGIWEMAIKISLGKLHLPATLSDFVREHIRGNKIDILSIELGHLYQLERLEYYHRDPFDRLLIAQAMSENITIISSDGVFERYPVQRIW